MPITVKLLLVQWLFLLIEGGQVSGPRIGLTHVLDLGDGDICANGLRPEGIEKIAILFGCC